MSYWPGLPVCHFWLDPFTLPSVDARVLYRQAPSILE